MRGNRVTDHQLKIRIVVRGQGKVISESAGDGAGPPAGVVSEQPDRITEDKRPGARVLAVGAAAILFLAAGGWWLGAGNDQLVGGGEC